MEIIRNKVAILFVFNILTINVNVFAMLSGWAVMPIYNYTGKPLQLGFNWHTNAGATLEGFDYEKSGRNIHNIEHSYSAQSVGPSIDIRKDYKGKKPEGRVGRISAEGFWAENKKIEIDEWAKKNIYIIPDSNITVMKESGNMTVPLEKYLMDNKIYVDFLNRLASTKSDIIWNDLLKYFKFTSKEELKRAITNAKPEEELYKARFLLNPMTEQEFEQVITNAKPLEKLQGSRQYNFSIFEHKGRYILFFVGQT